MSENQAGMSRRPLLQVENLAVRFGRAEPVVDGISFTVRDGESVAIVGESGSGKSVTARSILGLAGTGAPLSADVLRFDDVDLLAASGGRLRSLRGGDIGFVSQGALVALDPLRPVGREIADTLRLHTRMPAVARQHRVLEVLREVGMPEPELRARQRPGELSGGLRQRAIIASALALRPRLLIADEPTTALDTTVQAGILDLLDEVRAAGTAMLIISHDLAVVSRLASRIVVMRGGRVVESGETASVLGDPQHEYTRQLIAAVPTGRPRGSRLVLEERAAAADPVPDPAVAPVPSSPALRVSTETVLEATGLVRRFGTRIAVDDVGFTLRRGTTLAVIGESGSGKTTLARLALALDRPDAGSVTLLGEQWNAAADVAVGRTARHGIREADRRARRPRIGAIYQDALSSFDPRLTVGQILSDALTGGRSRRADVSALLADVGLPPEVARRRPRHLSGGQQQRVAIARAIAPGPDILVCDEPVSSLDVSVQAHVLDLLDDLQRRRSLAYLFITHDLGVARHVSDEVLVMRDGRVVEAGVTEVVFGAPSHDYTRALLAAAPRL